MPICDVTYEGNYWKKKHLRILQLVYGGSPFFDQYYPGIKNILDNSKQWLADLNLSLTQQMAIWLGVSIPTGVIEVRYQDNRGDAIDKIIELCELTSGDSYLSKPGAGDYIGPEEEERLAKAGIKHMWLDDWIDPDEKPLSAIHHLFTLGPDAKELI